MNIKVLFPLINNTCAVCISLAFQHQRLPAASLSPSTFSKDRSPHAERQALLTCLHTLKGWGIGCHGYHQISQFTLEYLGILAILGIMGEVVNSKENGSMQHDVSIYYRYTIWYTLLYDTLYTSPMMPDGARFCETPVASGHWNHWQIRCKKTYLRGARNMNSGQRQEKVFGLYISLYWHHYWCYRSDECW